MKKGIYLAVAVAGVLGAVSACTKKDADAIAAAAATFSKAFPSGLAVSSPTSSTASVSAKPGYKLQSLKGGIQAMTIDSDATAEAKSEALADTLTATTCTIAVDIQAAGNDPCYGPSVNYQNHPNSFGNAPGGDLGIFDQNAASGEACAAAQLNSRVGGVASLVDTGMFAAAGVLCQANLNGESLPSVGNTVDVTSDMASSITVNGTALTVTAATLARETDDADGNAVYVTTITGSQTVTSVTTTYTIRLKHVPTAVDNSTYKGKLSVKISKADGSNYQNCGSVTGASTGQTDAISISYEKTSATAVKYELSSANFCGDNADPYVSSTNKTVDLTKMAVSTTVPGGWANNANYLLASYNPTDFTGTFKYSWQAGSGDGAARNFNAQISSTGGVAYFGFGVDLDTATGKGDIAGMRCNWLNGVGSSVNTTKAQKQILTLTAGEYVTSSTDSFITYDPVDSCESSDSLFTVQKSSGGTIRAANTTTLDLVNITDISSNISTITAPTDIE